MARGCGDGRSDCGHTHERRQYRWLAAVVLLPDDRLDRPEDGSELEGVARMERHKQERLDCPAGYSRLDRVVYERQEGNEVSPGQRAGNC